MGDRAVVQLFNQLPDAEGNPAVNVVSPVLYVHWLGTDIASVIREAEKVMRGRADDVDYAFARLVAVACARDPGNSGVGAYNLPGPMTEHDSHGDHGCFVVDVTTESWEIYRFGRSGSRAPVYEDMVKRREAQIARQRADE